MNVFLDRRLELSNNQRSGLCAPSQWDERIGCIPNTPKGADTSAAIYSIVETAKANGLRPFPYLKLLLEQLPFGVPVEVCLPWDNFVRSLRK